MTGRATKMIWFGVFNPFISAGTLITAGMLKTLESKTFSNAKSAFPFMLVLTTISGKKFRWKEWLWSKLVGLELCRVGWQNNWQQKLKKHATFRKAISAFIQRNFLQSRLLESYIYINMLNSSHGLSRSRKIPRRF